MGIKNKHILVNKVFRTHFLYFILFHASLFNFLSQFFIKATFYKVF